MLPPQELEYKNEYGIKTKVRVMNIREITAEKIRAMSDRVRYRDFYDFAMIVKKLSINLSEILDLVRKKEIRGPISKQNILGNWELAKQEKQKDLSSIHYADELNDAEINNELNKLDFDMITNN